MKPQASPSSFGCLFHQMPFYHRPEQPSVGRKLKETARSKLNSPQSRAPATFSELKTERGHGLFKASTYDPRPPSLMCSVEGAWLNKTKIPMKQTSQKTSASSFPHQCSGRGSLREPQAPHASILAGCCLASPHSQNHFLCKTSSLRRKNALVV